MKKKMKMIENIGLYTKCIIFFINSKNAKYKIKK